jgi:hypothetical protein
MIKKLRNIILILSISVFLISLTQPAFYTSAQEPGGWSDSFGLVWMGWMGVLYGGAGFSWLANPLILAAWICLSKYTNASLILSGLSLFYSLLFLFYKSIITGEDGHYSLITARKAGYWLWLMSIFIFAIGTLISFFIERKQTKQYSSII